MATVSHVTSGLGLRKFQADGFLLIRVYLYGLMFTAVHYSCVSLSRAHSHTNYDCGGIRMPLGLRKSVCCECCVLSGRGLCDRPIPRLEESCPVFRWMWSCATLTFDTHNEKVDVRLRKKEGKKDANYVTIFLLFFSNLPPTYSLLLPLPTSHFLLASHLTSIFFFSFFLCSPRYRPLYLKFHPVYLKVSPVRDSPDRVYMCLAILRWHSSILFRWSVCFSHNSSWCLLLLSPTFSCPIQGHSFL